MAGVIRATSKRISRNASWLIFIPTEARKAEEEFNAMFRNKQAPEDVEERTLASGTWKLPKLLVELGWFHRWRKRGE